MNSTPASSLTGIELENGWKVQEIIKPAPQSTGGYFSIGYLVVDKSGNQAYLKALDFSSAFDAPDAARRLEEMTTAYNFERDLLAKCKRNRLQRVVTPIADGSVIVSGFGKLGRVFFLIFEKAEGDIRTYYNQLKQFDLAWCLRSLHNAAVGLEQLHSHGIAHQDLKPSNVLYFEKIGSKLSDLGRAADRLSASPMDEALIPGDIGYAPIEQFYGYKVRDDFECKFCADMYLLGSLIFFYFLKVSVTVAIMTKLKSIISEDFTNTDFFNDLPYIRNAFFETITDLEKEISKYAGKITDDIVSLAKELCEPDPRLRGHPKNRATGIQRYGLVRYISKLDLLAQHAEYNLI